MWLGLWLIFLPGRCVILNNLTLAELSAVPVLQVRIVCRGSWRSEVTQTVEKPRSASSARYAICCVRPQYP